MKRFIITMFVLALLSPLAYSSEDTHGIPKTYKTVICTKTANAADEAITIPVGYLMIIKYKAAGDDAFTFDIEDSGNVSYIGGDQSITDGTTGGWITSMPDRMPVGDKPLYITLGSFAGTTVTFTLYITVEH